MAYSDNLMAMDSSWMFHNAFPDTWLQDNFSKETETIAKALQNSFDFQDFDNNNVDFSSELVSPWLHNSDSTTVSGGSVDKENNSSIHTKKRRNMVSGGGGGGGEKIKKRRPRASKRAKVTFINANVDNFRQLVQEVTGVKFSGGGGGGGGGGVVKPEAQRAVNRLQMIGGGGGDGDGGLPTLDTSAFMVGPSDQNNQLHQVGHGGGGGVVAAGGSSQFDFDSCCSFPTLESWNAI